MSIGTEVHDLLVRPKNTSLVLGALKHVAFKPADAVAHKLTGHHLPTALNPETWGAGAAKAVEKGDFHLGRLALRGGLPGRMDAALDPLIQKLRPDTQGHYVERALHREESITLDHHHLAHIRRKLDAMDSTRRDEVTHHLNLALSNHYNNVEGINGVKGIDIDSLTSRAALDKTFKHTVHGVKVPSITGETGKALRSFGADVASMYGASEIVSDIETARQTPQEKIAMSQHTEIADLLNKAAGILESIPVRDHAYKLANDLYEAGAIMESEIEKTASMFVATPDHADDIFASMVRGAGGEKTANLGEPVLEDHSGKSDSGAFERLCLDGSPLIG